MAPMHMLTLATAGPSREVLDVLFLLGAAAVVAVLSRRLRLPTIPGYLIIGALVGPAGIALVDSKDSVLEIRELAIILLMFTIGMHMDLDSMRSGMVRILTLGLVSTLGVILVGWPVAMAFGASAPVAMVVAMSLSISSTAVALGVLQQRREMHLLHGRMAVGISLVQDLMSVVMLAVLPAIAAWAGVNALMGEGSDVAKESVPGFAGSGLPMALEYLSGGLLKLGGLGMFLVFGRYLLPRVLREASSGGGAEQLLVVSAAVAMGAAGLTWYLGFGPVLGAFLAGFMLASTPFKYQLAGQLSPLRDLFMAVFFTAVGMNIALESVLINWWIILLGVAMLLVIKTLVLGLTTWACGATAGVSATTALLLAQAGEFSMVILQAAVMLRIVPPGVEGVVIAITVLSLVVATPWYDLSRRITPKLLRVPTARWVAGHTLRDHLHVGSGRPASAQQIARAVLPGSGGVAGVRLRSEATSPNGGIGLDTPAAVNSHGADPAALAAIAHSAHGAGGHSGAPSHVIIAGFGVVGRNLGEHFAAAGIPFVVIELNASTVRKQQSLGRRTVYGDVANPDVLEQAGIHEAMAVMLTIPDDEATLRACQAVRAISSDVFIAARTSYLSKAIAATELGADYVTVEEVVTAQDMAKHVMSRLTKRIAAVKH